MSIRLEDIRDDKLRRRLRDALDIQNRATIAQVKREAVRSTPTSFEHQNASGSNLEQKFEIAWLESNGPKLEREKVLLPPRRWRVDFYEPQSKTVIEVEGGTFSQGRHNRGKGYEGDCEKYNALTLAGYKVFRVTGAMIRKELVETLIEYVNKNKAPERSRKMRLVRE